MEVLRLIHIHVPKPVAAFVTRWNSDPFSRGSYSYLPPGMAGRDYDILSYPVNDKILFAGEHTMRPYPSTVHGACASGRREADRVVDWITRKLEKEKVQKWFHGPDGHWYSVDLNDIDCQTVYVEDVMEGPTFRERIGWFSFLKCAMCGEPQSIERPFTGCFRFGDIHGKDQRWAVHEDCCYHSPEVGSNNEGSRWYNVAKALKRSASLLCVVCKYPGATIGCSVSSCGSTVHLPCAKKQLGWPNYDETSSNEPLYCPHHLHLRGSSGKATAEVPLYPPLSTLSTTGASQTRETPQASSSSEMHSLTHRHVALSHEENAHTNSRGRVLSTSLPYHPPTPYGERVLLPESKLVFFSSEDNLPTPHILPTSPPKLENLDLFQLTLMTMLNYYTHTTVHKSSGDEKEMREGPSLIAKKLSKPTLEGKSEAERGCRNDLIFSAFNEFFCSENANKKEMKMVGELPAKDAKKSLQEDAVTSVFRSEKISKEEEKEEEKKMISLPSTINIPEDEKVLNEMTKFESSLNERLRNSLLFLMVQNAGLSK
uniref:Polyamine oxidase n=1 Tax=Nephromyces sp. MMRI TaxID=2496275 RepID=A0A3Q8UC34_9APIC|nr:polyamine oxidase [Nephromyces sp. MMRI]